MKSGLLAGIKWSVCMLKSQRSLCVSFSRTGAWLFIYHLFVWSNWNFLHISQWTTLPTQSCLALYSFCANLLLLLLLILILLLLFTSWVFHISFVDGFHWSLSDSMSPQFCWILLGIIIIIIIKYFPGYLYVISDVSTSLSRTTTIFPNIALWSCKIHC